MFEFMKEKQLHFCKVTEKGEMAFVGHMLQGSSGDSALTLLEGKRMVKKRKTWRDADWWHTGNELDSYKKIKIAAKYKLKWRAVAREP